MRSKISLLALLVAVSFARSAWSDTIDTLPSEKEAKRVAAALSRNTAVIGTRLYWVRSAVARRNDAGGYGVHADVAALFDLAFAASPTGLVQRRSECGPSSLMDEPDHLDPETGGPAAVLLTLNHVLVVAKDGSTSPVLGAAELGGAELPRDLRSVVIPKALLEEGATCFSNVERRRLDVDAAVTRIRERYREINGSKLLRRVERSTGTGWFDGETLVKLETGGSGGARQSSREYYFDSAGRLVFLFEKGSALGDHVWVCRSYYDEGQRRIRFLVGDGSSDLNPGLSSEFCNGDLTELRPWL